MRRIDRKQALSLIGIFVVSLLVAQIVSVRDVKGNTFTVTTTADNGNDSAPTAGSLRKAIIDANASGGLDTIQFNIPGTGVQTIQPPAALPIITSPVIIDGYTQPGAVRNTSATGWNGTLRVELNGTNVLDSGGLIVRAGGSTIRGLIINRFHNELTSTNFGIVLQDIGGNVVEGNFIGTGPTGQDRLGNDGGIAIGLGTENTIGGTTPAARNVISGNLGPGIYAAFTSGKVPASVIMPSDRAACARTCQALSAISRCNAATDSRCGKLPSARAA